MDYREASLEEIARRIKRDRDLLNLKSFKWNSNDPVNKINIPAIYMFEGRDTIKEYISRNKIGYPCKRHLEVNIEMIVENESSIKDDFKKLKIFYQKVRRSVFCDREDIIRDEVKSIVWTPNNTLAKNSYMLELRTKGPNTYEIPELIGMKMVVGVWYDDFGFFDEKTRKVIDL
jgi:hypothetical protein